MVSSPTSRSPRARHLGEMGDPGNAAGTPQLHAEIHYPQGSGFTCSHCTPNKKVTSIDPEASLIRATRRA
jgi:hypothetical protein